MLNRDSSLRRKLYKWRQTRPGARFFAGSLVIALWPLRFVVFKILVLVRPHAPKRILVIQLAGLGDALMLTPALAALKNQYPAAAIHLFTLHGYVKDGFVNHPKLAEITALPAYQPQWVISKFSKQSGLSQICAALTCYPTLLLRAAFSRYDLGINFALSDFDRNVGNALLYCLTICRRVGLSGDNDWLLTDAVSVNYSQLHRAAGYAKFLEPLGIFSPANRYEYPVTAEQTEKMQSTLRAAGLDSSRPLAVIHPGGKIHINSRRWPAKHFARVCEFLIHREGFDVALTGDADDAAVCDEVAATLGERAKSLAGRLTFAENAALLSLAELCITNDTSTLHLAEAAEVPRVISIFGPTDPDLLVPENTRQTVFRSDLACAPCMGGIIDGNSQRCWRDINEECLSGIGPDQLIDFLKQNYAIAARA